MPHEIVRRSWSFLGRVWRLAGPYWSSEERWRARWLLGAIVALALGLVYILVRLNEWNRLFYNALEQHDYGAFRRLLLHFTLLAAVYIAAAVYKLYLTQMLQMRWRTWLTRRYLAAWTTHQAYYRLELETRGTDNPDQRIAEDVRLFTGATLTLSLGLFSAAVTLVSFVGILWKVSGPLDTSVGGLAVHVPGYLVWAAIVYAIAGSALGHRIGRPLARLNVLQQRVEADFRFGLVRLRENAEGIALYRGEPSERASLLAKFEEIRANWWHLMRVTKRLTGFTVGYGQVAVIVPILVAAPRYFAGALTLGGLMQISQAFGQVQGALSWLVDGYPALADWKASVDRLLTFSEALDHARTEAARGEGPRVETGAGRALQAVDLGLALPDGRVVLEQGSLTVSPRDRVLITGVSGVGKSTLFRALAGIWPFGQGRVRVPEGARMLFLPQKPYLPIGSLRTVVSYPAASGRFSDTELREALRACRLAGFADRLDEHGNWAQRLSVGEQQRLAVARALLHRPDWLFLDEATASVDETTEAHLYRVLQTRLPTTAVVSIGHRPGLAAYHTSHVVLAANGTGPRLAVAPDGRRLAAAARPAS